MDVRIQKKKKRMNRGCSREHPIKKVKRVVIFLLILLMGGCASFVRYDIRYDLPNGNRMDHPFPFHPVVKKFVDARPMDERISKTPVGGTKSGDDWFKGSLNEEIPTTMARDLAETNMFKTVVYSDDSLNISAETDTLFLQGKIHSFEYADGNTSRSGRTEIRVKLSIQLLDPKNNVIWNPCYSRRNSGLTFQPDKGLIRAFYSKKSPIILSKRYQSEINRPSKI